MKKLATKILCGIGYVHLHVQSTEKAVKLCMQVVLPHEKYFFLSLSERLDEHERKNPLGHFLKALRTRAEIQPDVDDLLTRFLQHRNTFAHNLGEVPGWNLRTKEGCATANQFLSNLLAESKEVRLVFMGLLNAWKIQSGIETSAEEDAQFEDLSKYQKPIISRIYQKNA